MSFNPNLKENEEKLVQTLIGKSRKLLFGGIAEVLISPLQCKENWNSIVKPGVVCFVKDLNKKAFFLQVVNMTKGQVAWNQNIDNEVIIQRRRRWIFLLETGYSKVLLNFIDDYEADAFSTLLSKYFPEGQEIQKTSTVTPYTITEDGYVVRNKKSFRRNEKQNQTLKKVVKMVGLPESVLDDPDIVPTIEEICREYGSEMEKMEEELDELEDAYGGDCGDIFGKIYDDLDSPPLPETPSHSLQKSATWSGSTDHTLGTQKEQSTKISRKISDPTPALPMNKLPPPPPPPPTPN